MPRGTPSPQAWHVPIHTSALESPQALGAEVALLAGVALCSRGAIQERAPGTGKALNCAAVCHVRVLRAFISYTGHAVVARLQRKHPPVVGNRLYDEVRVQRVPGRQLAHCGCWRCHRWSSIRWTQ